MFHYDYVIKTWPGKNLLLFTDTDSLTYWIETEDVYKDMLPAIGERFDTSKYPDNHPSGIKKGVNSGKIGGIFKDEFSSEPVKRFRGLSSKHYFIDSEKSCVKRNKGVPTKSVVEPHLSFEHYDKCLRENRTYHARFPKINSKCCQVTTDLMEKEALSGYDDKRYVIPLDPLYKTMAWFHKDLPESVREHCDQNGQHTVYSRIKMKKVDCMHEYVSFYGDYLCKKCRVVDNLMCGGTYEKTEREIGARL